MPGHWGVRITELRGSNTSEIIGGSFIIDKNITIDMGAIASRIAEWINPRLGGLSFMSPSTIESVEHGIAIVK